MKNLFLFLVSLSFTLAAWSGEDISHFRDNFAKIKDYKSAELFLDTEVTESNYQYAVTINSYKAVCKMMMAQYVYNPFSKYSWFNEGKDMLEKTISLNKNVENVYLRLVVQLNVPSFLSYTTDIESDVKFILDNLEKSSVPDNTKTYILKSLADTEKKQVKSLLPLAKKYKAI